MDQCFFGTLGLVKHWKRVHPSGMKRNEGREGMLNTDGTASTTDTSQNVPTLVFSESNFRPECQLPPHTTLPQVQSHHIMNPQWQGQSPYYDIYRQPPPRYGMHFPLEELQMPQAGFSRLDMPREYNSPFMQHACSGIVHLQPNFPAPMAYIPDWYHEPPIAHSMNQDPQHYGNFYSALRINEVHNDLVRPLILQFLSVNISFVHKGMNRFSKGLKHFHLQQTFRFRDSTSDEEEAEEQRRDNAKKEKGGKRKTVEENGQRPKDLLGAENDSIKQGLLNLITTKEGLIANVGHLLSTVEKPTDEIPRILDEYMFLRSENRVSVHTITPDHHKGNKTGPKGFSRPSAYLKQKGSHRGLGQMALYEIHAEDVMRDMGSRTAKCKLSFDSVHDEKEDKYIILIGASGAGKSTLVNAFVNHFYGVDWEDPFRLVLIPNTETRKSKAESQTSWITAYTFPWQDGCRAPYNLTVVDTPGFGDTKGLAADRSVMTQLQKFVMKTNSEGLNHIDGIGFVLQASNARLTPTEKYIFDSLISTFGKDVVNNIYLMITFADSKTPPVLEAVKEANIPFVESFRFNNSALFSPNDEKDSQDFRFDSMFWKLGARSFSKSTPLSLQLSKEVLKERQALEATIQGIQNRIHDERHGKLKPGKNVTPEALSSNHDYRKAECDIFGPQSGHCNVCPFKCHWKEHVISTHYLEKHIVKETKTLEYLKRSYGEGIQGKVNVKQLKKASSQKCAEIQSEILDLVKDAHQKLCMLHDNTMKPDPIPITDYMDLLISSETLQRKQEWMERVQVLQEIREHMREDGTFLRVEGESIGTINSEAAQTRKTSQHDPSEEEAIDSVDGHKVQQSLLQPVIADVRVDRWFIHDLGMLAVKRFLLPSCFSLSLVCRLHILRVAVVREMECILEAGGISLDGVGLLQGISFSKDGNESSLLPFNVSGDFARRPLIEGLEFDQSPPSLASRKVESLNGSLRMVGVMHGQEFSGRSIDGLEFRR
ncbi:unnamed protein product [Darwinula stevensoni]|uniref:Septin-type G domain-containing protein n=1 Tax=Darwinula stevensoni TaxID=69355 RepID=A0A7R9ABM0_9CRUS|nr:unnamed protein product [Darwinula stevensoni]CAG0899189.1 unnamed protein product [Darwinula stevensoni]